MPGRAAFVDGRGGSSMRLNFSGADEDEIREGVRRIGEVVREQVALYGTLTGAAPAAPDRPRRPTGSGQPPSTAHACGGRRRSRTPSWPRSCGFRPAHRAG